MSLITHLVWPYTGQDFRRINKWVGSRRPGKTQLPCRAKEERWVMVRAELAAAAMRGHLGVLTSEREYEPELGFTASEVSVLARLNPERPAGASSPAPLPQLGALALASPGLR